MVLIVIQQKIIILILFINQEGLIQLLSQCLIREIPGPQWLVQFPHIIVILSEFLFHVNLKTGIRISSVLVELIYAHIYVAFETLVVYFEFLQLTLLVQVVGVHGS